MDDIDWQKKWAEADAHHEKQLVRGAARRGVDGEIYGALLSAFRTAKESDLLGTRDEYGELRFTPEQGAKAACYAREDAGATLLIQRHVLMRLAGLRTAAWLSVCLLAYIAIRVT